MPARPRKGVVLVVEDDDGLRDAIVDALHGQDYAALAARHGSDALAMLDSMRDSVPDVIVLDLAMPVMDGHEFLAARAERPEMAFVPVVVTSGSPSDRDLSASAWNEYVAKPFALDDLMAAIERCCSLHRRLAAS